MSDRNQGSAPLLGAPTPRIAALVESRRAAINEALAQSNADGTEWRVWRTADTEFRALPATASQPPGSTLEYVALANVAGLSAVERQERIARVRLASGAEPRACVQALRENGWSVERAIEQRLLLLRQESERRR